MFINKLIVDKIEFAKHLKNTNYNWDPIYSMHFIIAKIFEDEYPRNHKFEYKTGILWGISKNDLIQILKNSSCELKSNFIINQSKSRPILLRNFKNLVLNIEFIPTVRIENKDVDYFLKVLNDKKEKQNRFELYLELLNRRLLESFKIKKYKIENFITEKDVIVKNFDPVNNVNKKKKLKFPLINVKIQGDIIDKDIFSKLLLKGIGRFSKFGYGSIFIMDYGND